MKLNSNYRIYTCLKHLVLFPTVLVSSLAGWAQAKPNTGKNVDPASLPRPTDIKVLEEHKDKNGNMVRTIQYYQGGNRITETQMVVPPLNLHAPINPDTLNQDSLVLVVNKSRFAVYLMYRRKTIRYYKAVFGPKPQENKKMAGDRCTPEGWFKIQSKNASSKYDKFMLIDYPNDSARLRFAMLKQKGAIPQSAAIGGDVGIHGIWKGGDEMIDMGVGWTDGCIALKNKDIEELYTLVAVGTKVLIKK